MLEPLRDPVWQFVGVVLAVLGIVAAIWIYRLQRQTKELAFGLISSRRPLAITDEISSRVTVQLDGRSVGNLHLLVFGLKNSGHRAIAPTDFDRPLRIHFADGQVVSAEISAQSPSNLGAELHVSDTYVELRPLLLNPGDQLLIQGLLSSVTPNYSLDARVLDVPSIAPVNETPRLPPFFSSSISWLMFVALATGLCALAFTEKRYEAYFLLGFAAYILAFGVVTRLLQHSGKSARRRINEA